MGQFPHGTPQHDIVGHQPTQTSGTSQAAIFKGVRQMHLRDNLERITHCIHGPLRPTSTVMSATAYPFPQFVARCRAEDDLPTLPSEKEWRDRHIQARRGLLDQVPVVGRLVDGFDPMRAWELRRVDLEVVTRVPPSIITPFSQTLQMLSETWLYRFDVTKDLFRISRLPTTKVGPWFFYSNICWM